MAATSILLNSYKGIRNDKPPEMLAPDELVMGLNIDLDNSRQPARRAGYARKLALSSAHSGWATHDQNLFVFAQGTTLNSLNDSMTSATVLRSDLTPGLPISYWEHAGRVYYTNGAETGVLEARTSRSWGLEVPAAPALAATGGSMPAGRYLVSCTFLALDGQESGAPPSTLIELPTGGGINVTLPTSADPRVAAVVVYCSTADGTQLYEAGRFVSGTAHLGSDQRLLQRPLLTQHLHPAPAGQACAFYRGRMYVARDNLLFYSSAHGLELFSPVDFLAFANPITILAPTTDGIYVGSSVETVFLSGTGPDDFTQLQRQGWGAVPGTLVYYPVGRIANQNTEVLAPIWLSTQGIVTGLPSGQLDNRTETWDFNAPTRGAGLFRRHPGGLYQYIVTFTGV